MRSTDEVGYVLDRFYLLRDLQKSPTGNAPEGLSVPPAGGTAKAVGGLRGFIAILLGM